ncbi:MAG: hypothetical protein IT426_10940 [Pirellulales bacterium]|nr:hypothetical protein [Pirellulales bacterium]
MWRSGMSCRLWFLAAAAAVGSGCANWQTPRIDPTGEHVFAPDSVAPQSPVGGYGNPQAPPGDPEIIGVTISPAEQIAPVGSEVYLVAGVAGADGYLKAHRRLEWTISPGTVGQFTKIAESDCFDRLLGDNHPHKIVSGTYAVGGTLHLYEQLTRGTPDPADDVAVTSGQSWVALTSAIEGDSVVTVAAPEVYGWNCRQKSATIHWLDVNWRFPSPAIIQTGTKHALTTMVSKRTSQSPCGGWVVRYSVVGGPPAGFSPDGAISVEVVTNAAGQASAELFQKAPANGTNQINIEVMRPGDLPGAGGKKVVLGRGAAMVTWTTSPVPAQNIGPTGGNAVPAPAGVPSGVGAGAGGAAGVVPSAGAAGASASPIEISISEPPPTPVGSEAKFDITITNRTAQRLEKLKLYDAFDPGLQHAKDVERKNHVDADLGALAANQPAKISLTFKVLQPGMQCHTVKVLDANGKTIAGKKAYVMGVGASLPPSGTGGPASGTPPPREKYGDTARGAEAGTPPGGTGTPAAGQFDLDIKVTGPPTKRTVGEIAPFKIEITNKGTKAHHNLRVEALLDPVFERETGKTIASQGFWHDKGGLYYLQPDLPAGMKLKLEIQSKCLQPSPRAKAAVRVTSAEGGRAEGEAGCEILAADAPPGDAPGTEAESTMQMAMTCSANPARVGKQFNCLITVVNHGNEDEQNVTVEVEVPVGLVFFPLGTVGPPSNPKHRVENRYGKQTVCFEPIPTLPPGQPQRYRVLVKALAEGNYSFRANMSSRKILVPVRKEQSVDVTK